MVRGKHSGAVGQTHQLLSYHYYIVFTEEMIARNLENLNKSKKRHFMQFVLHITCLLDLFPFSVFNGITCLVMEQLWRTELRSVVLSAVFRELRATTGRYKYLIVWKRTKTQFLSLIFGKYQYQPSPVPSTIDSHQRNEPNA